MQGEGRRAQASAHRARIPAGPERSQSRPLADRPHAGAMGIASSSRAPTRPAVLALLGAAHGQAITTAP